MPVFKKERDMFNSRRSFTGNRYRGGGQRGPRQFSRFKGRQPSFNPTLFITNNNYQPSAETAYEAKNRFEDLAVAEQLKQNISRKGYTQMTPIQDEGIGPILAGKDVVGLANTGTGKTAAFLIPLISRVSQKQTTRVLIVTPTRELAMQILDEFRVFANGLGIFSGLIIGGASMNRQIENLKRRPEFIIGTPGRLLDLEKRKKIHFGDFQTIVLDEVDRMLDMGFVTDIQYIVGKLPLKRHSLFFSATIPDKAREVMKRFLTNPIIISVSKQQTAVNVEQAVVRLSGKARVEVLHDLLRQSGFDKVLVFGRTKWGIEKLAKELQLRGFRVAAIHGNKTQGQRQKALQDFKNNRTQVLLATDLASRGLDIDKVTHVINYDLPATREDYIHRIGRTGRADKKGIALTLVD